MTRRSLLITLSLVLSGIGQNAEAAFCPLCTPSITLAEQMGESDAVVLVRLLSTRKPTEEIAGQSTYEVEKVISNAQGLVRKRDRIALSRYYPGKKGDLYLLMGKRIVVVEWDAPIAVTNASFNYITQAPAPEVARVQRLAYFLNFLEHSDPAIANDAYAEFANASYKNVSALRKQIPRVKVRKWIADSETSPTRMGLYGLLLGISGNKDDAALLKKQILATTQNFRLGIDGVMSGYLILEGEKGLKILEDSKFKDKEVPFSETYAAMQAIRFMWTYAPDKISKNRLRESMRILLDRTELADLVIANLCRWEDWSIQDRLMAMYDDKEFNVPATKRAIIRYMLVCSRDFQGKAGVPPKHVVKARQNMHVLRKKDSKMVKNTERYYFLKRSF